MDEIKALMSREETADLVFRGRLPMIAMEPSADQLYATAKVHHTQAHII
jgi:hypothetical protein